MRNDKTVDNYIALERDPAVRIIITTSFIQRFRGVKKARRNSFNDVGSTSLFKLVRNWINLTLHSLSCAHIHPLDLSNHVPLNFHASLNICAAN